MTDAQCWMMRNPSKNGGDSREQQVHTLVREFYEIRKSQEVAVTKPPPPLRRRPIVAVLAIVLCVAAWLVPLLIAKGSVPSQESLERNARLSIYLASLSVRTYQRQTGRVPASTVEARLEDSSISYQRLSDSTFELSRKVGDANISYQSTSNIAFFLRSDSVLARKQ